MAQRCSGNPGDSWNMRLNKVTKTIAIVIAIVIVLIVLLFTVWNEIPYLMVMILFGRHTYERIELFSKTYNESIYIKSHTWGMPDSRNVLVISTSSEKKFKPDNTRDYVYHSIYKLFYKFENDTLFFVQYLWD